MTKLLSTVRWSNCSSRQIDWDSTRVGCVSITSKGAEGFSFDGGQLQVVQALGVHSPEGNAGRKARYLQSLGTLTNALSGRPLDTFDTELRLNPSAPTLVERIWEAALTEQADTTVRAGGRYSHRFHPGGARGDHRPGISFVDSGRENAASRPG
ncbi:hypothetical protein, partial [Rhodococcus globerulus]